MKIPDALIDTDCNAIIMTSTQSIKQLVRNLRRQLPLRTRLAIDVLIDESPLPNGYARLAENFQVALNLGFVLWAVQVSSNLTFEIRGDDAYVPQTHDLSAQKYASCVDTFDAVQTLNANRSHLIPEQKGAQLLLATIFMKLIWFHELAHVFRGHLNLLQAEFNARPLTLWDDYDIREYDDTVLMRAIEYDADRWAGFLAANIAYARPTYFPLLRKRHPHHTLSFMIYCYAVVCGYRHHRNIRDGQDSPEYPRPLARIGIFLSGMQVYLDPIIGERTIDRILREAMGFTMLAADIFPELNGLYDLTERDFRESLIAHGESVIWEYHRFQKRIWSSGYLTDGT